MVWCSLSVYVGWSEPSAMQTSLLQPSIFQTGHSLGCTQGNVLNRGRQISHGKNFNGGAHRDMPSNQYSATKREGSTWQCGLFTTITVAICFGLLVTKTYDVFPSKDASFGGCVDITIRSHKSKQLNKYPCACRDLVCLQKSITFKSLFKLDFNSTPPETITAKASIIHNSSNNWKQTSTKRACNTLHYVNRKYH